MGTKGKKKALIDALKPRYYVLEWVRTNRLWEKLLALMYGED